jgi:hypothetical protein
MTFMGLAAAQDADRQESTLRNVSFRNNTDIRLTGVSVMGGAEMLIATDGIYEEVPQSNVVNFIAQQDALTDFFTEGYMVGPTLEENDAFASKVLGGELAHTTPSLETLTGIPVDQMWQKTSWEDLWDGSF